MATMAKITRIETERYIMAYPEIQDQFENKITEMMLLEKTISRIESPDQNTFVRYWADQESAQEWIDFVSETLASVGGAYTSAQILDNPEL